MLPLSLNNANQSPQTGLKPIPDRPHQLDISVSRDQFRNVKKLLRNNLDFKRTGLGLDTDSCLSPAERDVYELFIGNDS